jgi:deoxyribodipyrimidine photo-lyase
MNSKIQVDAIFWFRRDLRLNDNTALFYALRENTTVLPVFIFDTNILGELEDKKDKRVSFIWQMINEIQNELFSLGASLRVLMGDPKTVWKQLVEDYHPSYVYVNEDYEPYARKREADISAFLKNNNIEFKVYKDQVIFSKNDVIKNDGSPYTVFTPYSVKWKQRFHETDRRTYPSEKYFSNFLKISPFAIPSLNEIGFQQIIFKVKPASFGPEKIKYYSKQRDVPAIDGTSSLSVHLRFGTVSIRSLVNLAEKNSEAWLNELIWREFFMMILWFFPDVERSSFKRMYDKIRWRNNEHEFQRWCNGTTGFPLVDAGMRELIATGFMHNRARMVVSNFLVKDLLIDWRWGEAWFASKLLDFELSSNNGNWQWAAGCGCDAAPYFRIFNPAEQLRKFDPDLDYVKKWIPEYGTEKYPSPIVDHKLARERALRAYKKALADF